MHARFVGNAVEFSGVLNEHTSGARIASALLEGRAGSGRSERVRVDFSAVARANSAGFVTWIHTVRTMGFPILYVRAPEWLVENFNSMIELFFTNALVESLEAPFHCAETGEHENFTLLVGKDVPIRKEYLTWTMQKTDERGRTFEPEFDPESYFTFISTNFDVFKEWSDGLALPPVARSAPVR